MKKFLVPFFCLLSCFGKAQTEYPLFRDTASLKGEDSGRLSLSIENFNYLRNYEWFGDIALSYTLLGYQLIPQLQYQLNEHITFKGGVLLRRELGRPGFVSADPVFTAKYQKKGLSFLMGTLEGALNHRFIEPLYNIERIITSRNEQGLQLKLDKKRFWMDWFIDWRRAIALRDPFREEFTTGISTRTRLVNKEGLKVEVPLQALIAHKGGQISSSPDPVESLFNSAAGLSFRFSQPGSFIHTVATEHYLTYYKNISGNKRRLYNRGGGWLSTLTFRSRLNLDLDLRYWKGQTFFGALGLPLYNSISEKKAGYGEPERQLIFATLIYNKQLFPHVGIDMRLEPYYDLNNKFLEYGYSVFLRFNKEFFLKRL